MFRGFRDDQKWRNHVKKYNANKDKNDVKELKLFRVCYEARAFQQFLRNEYNVDLDIHEASKIVSERDEPYYNPGLIKRETGTASKANEMYKEMLQDFDKRKDPTGRTYYWLTGRFQNFDKGDDTDEGVLANGYVSIVPVQYDVTDYDCISELKSWSL